MAYSVRTPLTSTSADRLIQPQYEDAACHRYRDPLSMAGIHLSVRNFENKKIEE